MRARYCVERHQQEEEDKMELVVSAPAMMMNYVYKSDCNVEFKCV